MSIFEYKDGSIGPLTSGMTRDQVRRLLGEHGEFRKSIFSENTTDDFPSSAVHVFYDENNKIKGVEVFKGASFIFLEKDIFCFDAGSAMDFFKRAGYEVELMDSGFNVNDIGASFYVPDLDDDSKAKILSIYFDL